MRPPAIFVDALDHVGIAAEKAAAHPLLRALGASTPEGVEMPSGVRVARFGPANALELVWPARAGTPIDGFLVKRGPGLHHVALSVRRPLGELAATLELAGLEPVGDIQPSSDGRPSLFLHPATTGGVLVELVERR
jgi:hypothetical protein